MPNLRRATGQRVGAFSTFRTFVNVLREVSFDDLRDEAELEPRVLVLADDEAAARRLGESLVGPRAAQSVTARQSTDQVDGMSYFDAIVVHDPGRTGLVARISDRVRTEDGPPPVFPFLGASPSDSQALESLRRKIATRLPDRAPAFGRAFEPFRGAAAKAVTDESAKANAQFALISNVPAVVPIVGSFAAAGADFLVLTKNQLLLMFKIAAIHDRDLHDQWGIIRELMPVVGAGLAWRTVAREMASFIPLAAGTIPKVAIAYAGTMAVGRGADFYYRTNRKPSRNQLHGYYQQAAQAVRKLPLPVPGRGDSQDEERDRGPGIQALPSKPLIDANRPGSEDGPVV